MTKIENFLNFGIGRANSDLKDFDRVVNNARIAQLVEHDLAKVGVADSSSVSRSKNAQVAELVDALDLKSSDHYGRAGSSPALGTKSR